MMSLEKTCNLYELFTKYSASNHEKLAADDKELDMLMPSKAC